MCRPIAHLNFNQQMLSYKCAFAKNLKLWSASEIQKMMASKLSADAMKVDSSMDTIRKNVAEWMFMAWDKL